MQLKEYKVIRDLSNEAAELGDVVQVMSAQANFVSVLLDPEGWVLNALPMPLALCDKPFNCCSLILSQTSSALYMEVTYGMQCNGWYQQSQAHPRHDDGVFAGYRVKVT